MIIFDVIFYLLGTLPAFRDGTKVELDEFTEEYSHPAPGDLRSVATRTLRLKNGGLEDDPSASVLVYELSQRFSYDPCKFQSPSDKPDPIKIRVSKNFIG